MPETPPLDPNVAADLARLALDLSHDPKTRKAFGKLVKEAKPDSPHARAFTDVDLEDKFDAFERKQMERELKTQQDAVVAQLNAQRQNLLTGGPDGSGPKYDEDTVKKIEKFMQDNGITNYHHGAVLFANENPPLTPPSDDDPPAMQGDRWTIPDFEKFKDDPDGAARSTAQAVIKEFRQRKRA
jgi:hypothetical protein